jgi:hypothetical protein
LIFSSKTLLLLLLTNQFNRTDKKIGWSGAVEEDREKIEVGSEERRECIEKD